MISGIFAANRYLPIQGDSCDKEELLKRFCAARSKLPQWNRELLKKSFFKGGIEIVDSILSWLGIEEELAEVIVYELLLNAIEHGCLQLSAEEKSLLVKKEDYLPYLQRRGGDCKIFVALFELDTKERAIYIKDFGKGFDYCRHKPYLYGGNGLFIAEHHSKLYFTPKGNALFVILPHTKRRG